MLSLTLHFLPWRKTGSRKNAASQVLNLSAKKDKDFLYFLKSCPGSWESQDDNFLLGSGGDCSGYWCPLQVTAEVSVSGWLNSIGVLGWTILPLRNRIFIVCTFIRFCLIFRWRGSVYKLVWIELLIYWGIFGIVCVIAHVFYYKDTWVPFRLQIQCLGVLKEV
jgi:hypothetical protein